MASSDESLRLFAALVNQTSGPLRDIQRSMRPLAAETSSVHAARRATHTAPLCPVVMIDETRRGIWRELVPWLQLL